MLMVLLLTKMIAKYFAIIFIHITSVL